MVNKDFILNSFLDSFGLSIPEEERKIFLSSFFEKKFKKGEHIVYSGSVSPFLGIIAQGLVRFYFITNDGKEYNQTFKKEHHLIADHYSILTGNSSIFSIQALEDTIVYATNYEIMNELYQKNRAWDRIGRLLIEKNFTLKAEREHSLLTLDAEGKYQKFLEDFKDFGDRLSQQEIALYIGVNPSTLNRLIKKLG